MLLPALCPNPGGWGGSAHLLGAGCGVPTFPCAPRLVQPSFYSSPPPSKEFPVLPVSGPGLLTLSRSQPWPSAMGTASCPSPWRQGCLAKSTLAPGRLSPCTPAQGGDAQLPAPHYPARLGGGPHGSIQSATPPPMLLVVLWGLSCTSRPPAAPSIAPSPSAGTLPRHALPVEHPRVPGPPMHPARHHMMPVPSLLRGGPQFLHWLCRISPPPAPA